MDSFFTRYKNSLALVALLLAQTIGLAIQVRRPVEQGAADGHHVRLVRYWFIAIVAPIEHAFNATGDGLRHAWFDYIDLRHARQQNQALQQQIAQLRIQQVAIAEDAIQGIRLQGILAFQQHYVSNTVAAQVIGTSGTDLSHVVYLDKGSADGLKPDQAVITPDGIVGKIRDVFPHTSQLLLINDQTSGAGVLLASTRIRGILHGTSTGRVVINNLTPDARIKPGETVLTSGGDQIFPRGLPVGTIDFIAPDPEHQPYTTIRIIPAANLNQLEEVLVITGTQPNLSLKTQQDLAAGAQATAEARAAAAKADADKATAAALAEAEAQAGATQNPDGTPSTSPLDPQSTSQIIAGRLPSLRDPNAKPGSSPTASLDLAVPRPLPTEHPDHFSPGTTPSAASMTPGGRSAADPTVSGPAPATNSPSSAPRKASAQPAPRQ